MSEVAVELIEEYEQVSKQDSSIERDFRLEYLEWKISRELSPS